MSAYGAYGFARHDFKYRRIVRHYYTDTKVGGLNHARRETTRLVLGHGSRRGSDSQALPRRAGGPFRRRRVLASCPGRLLGATGLERQAKRWPIVVNDFARLGERRWISRVTAPFAGRSAELRPVRS